jgi:hypothetical protein
MLSSLYGIKISISVRYGGEHLYVKYGWVFSFNTSSLVMTSGHYE